MSFLRRVVVMLSVCALPSLVMAQSGGESSQLLIELNMVQDEGEACRLTFLARNETGTTIDKAVFETVIIDRSGGVVRLSLFDFRDLPSDRPRVRQFDLPGLQCETIGQALINGANTCVVGNTDSKVCDAALSLGSRIDVELLG